MTAYEKTSCPSNASQGIQQQYCKRDAFVDHWRGIFHIILLFDHLPFILPTTFFVLSDFFQPFGYVSVAEGFVFLSGYVSGLVYTRIKREQGDQAMRRKTRSRAAQIYGCYVVASMLLVTLIASGGESSAQWGSWGNLAASPWLVATLQIMSLVAQPVFLEILPMYGAFLLATPWVIDELEKGNWITISLVSLAIWGGAQMGLRDAVLEIIAAIVPLQVGFFNSFGWQILFVAGLICGHKTFMAQSPWLSRNWMLAFSVYACSLALFALRHQIFRLDIAERWTEGSFVGPLRLLNFACLAFLICRFRVQIEKLIAWKGLAFLSQYSLPVFAFHLIPIYLATRWLDHAQHFRGPVPLLVFLWSVVGLFITAWMTMYLKNQWRLRITQSDTLPTGM